MTTARCYSLNERLLAPSPPLLFFHFVFCLSVIRSVMEVVDILEGKKKRRWKEKERKENSHRVKRQHRQIDSLFCQFFESLKYAAQTKWTSLCACTRYAVRATS